MGLNVFRCRAEVLGTQCLGGDEDVGLNVFRADVLGTQCLGGDDDVGLNVFRDTVPWW